MYIAMESCNTHAVYNAKFFSILAYASTESGNIEDKLFLAVYLDHSAKDKHVHICNPFFAVGKLESGDAMGLLACLERAMTHVGVVMTGKKN